jgi:predicted kinase
MSKLILMQGLPGSGKSTRAQELAKQYGNAIRVGRDQLREMLHFGDWSGKKEAITKEAQVAVVDRLLDNGHVVIVDDTNIQPSRIQFWRDYAKKRGIEIKWERMETPIEECQRRDMLRDKPVGSSVIVAMAMQAGIYPQPKKGIVICDLDGTLCNIEHRLHFVKTDPKDWKSFFAGIPNDTVNEEVLDTVMDYEGKGYEIFLVSARPDDHREATEAWLERTFQGYKPYKALLMRRKGDRRPDTETKEEMFKTYFAAYPVNLVIDDRPSVIRMWRKLGLNVMDVGAGVEF